jgi:hypothetical protein
MRPSPRVDIFTRGFLTAWTSSCTGHKTSSRVASSWLVWTP